MKTRTWKHRFGEVAAVGIVLIGLLALAAPSYAASGDSVIGGGRVGVGAATEDFAINARGAGTGDLATGTLSLSTAKAAVYAVVSCLHVSGDTAWVGETITHATPSVGALVGRQEVLIFIASSPEVISDTNDHDASTCGTEPLASTAFTVTRGSFTVTSAA